MSEENCTNISAPTYVALPVNSFQTNATILPEQFHIIKNAFIKTSEGSLCILDTNELTKIMSQPVEVTCLPASNNISQQKLSVDRHAIMCNTANNDHIHVPSTTQKFTTIYKCPKCKEVFKKIASYRKHMMWHRNVKKFKCDKCSAGYNVQLNLKIHMAMHAEGKPTCPICNICFQRLASLKSHLMLHQVEELYTCEECGAEFEKEEELNRHLKNHLNNAAPESSSLVCSYCSVQFENQKNFKEHISHHIKVKKMVLSGKKTRKSNGNKNHSHICSVCLKSFSKLSLLERHLRVHSGERPFICEHCNKGFNQKGTLQIHLSKHTGIKPFHCTLCSAKFNQKGNLRIHVEKTHTAPMPGVKMYKCPHCTCIFKKIASLNVHITRCHTSCEDLGDVIILGVMNKLKELEKHTSEMRDSDNQVKNQNKNFLNEVNTDDATNTSYVRLAESFLDGTVRRYLVMQKKVNDIKCYMCSYCTKEFKKPSDLIRHTRVHTREKPFSCKQCGVSFALKSTLFYHVKTHGNTSSNICNICMKKFSSLRSLNMHLRKHKQYKCVHCNKCFTTLQQIKFHESEAHSTQSNKTTTDQIEIQVEQPHITTSHNFVSQKITKESLKQYHCPICGTTFNKTPNLRRHMLIHADERKHKCNQCTKSYFTAHALKEHLILHSGIKNYGCKVCGKKFMTSSLLKRHSITHSTRRPYACQWCKKNFKTMVLCKKHIFNVHKREAILQVHITNENEAIKTVNELETTMVMGIVPTSQGSNNITLNTDNQQANTTIALKNQCLQFPSESIKTNLTHQNSVSTIIQAPVDQPFYEPTSNSIQIIANSDQNIEHNTNQMQTIYINCDDLQLCENLYSNNTDTLFTLNDLQYKNTFNIDPFGNNFDTQQIEVYNTNEVINIDKTIVELNNKVKIGPSKAKVDKQNANPNDTFIIGGSIPHYSQSDLNLLLSLDPELQVANCDLQSENLNLPDINLNDMPILNVDSQEQVEVVQEQEGRNKNKKKSFTCSKCNRMFTNNKIYMKHLQTHRVLRKGSGSCHQCSFCPKSFKKYSDLIRHIRTHTGEKPFACDKCERRFSLKSTLISHQRTHNPVIHKQFNCAVCNSFFSSKSSLKVHMSVHTGDKAHKCTICFMKFRTAAHRKSHENSYHLNPSKKKTRNKVTDLLASVAMDVLTNQIPNNTQGEQGIANDLENGMVQEQMQFPADPLHILSEANSNTFPEASHLEPLSCQQLQANMLLPENLIPSSLIQLDDGTLVNVKTINSACQERQGQNFDSLNLISKKPRNFECDVCKKKYTSKDVLRKHRKIHGLDKIFRCTKCEKGFDFEKSLKMHEKTHEGYRPFSCLYCANSFSKEHSLTTHMKRIHNISLKDFLL